MTTARNASGKLVLGGAVLGEIARDPRVGTPSYVYDLDGIEREAAELDAAFEGAPHLVAYAVKANSAGPIVRALVGKGCGIDVVSGGELALALACGASPDAIVYSGVAKSDAELDQAVLCGDRGIRAIQLESVEEIARVDARARAAGRVARGSIRINPGLDVDTLDTHAHIATGHDDAKFGIPLTSLPDALEALAAASHVKLVGLTSHVGSQITETSAYVESARVLFRFAQDVRKDPRFALSFVDTGGGFGIDYGEGCAARPADFVRAVRREQAAFGLGDLALFVEPGRSLVAAHGVLLARVLQRKITRDRRWIMIDAGMNDLMRPALYQARHRIEPLDAPVTEPALAFRVVGPVCESSDDFGEHRLPSEAFGLVAILDCGAYGYSMASRYNGRPLPAEVFLRGGAISAISPRRPVGDWVADRSLAG